MAFSRRNLLGAQSGSRKFSALEAAFNENDGSLYGVQPFGLLDGRMFGMSNDIVNDSAKFILTAVTTTGSATNALAAATATLPPYMVLTTGTTAHDNLQVQWAKPLTVGTATLTAFDPFIAKASYNIYLSARVMISTTVANCALLVGLVPVDTTLLASSTFAHTGGIEMFKAGSGATVAGIQRAASTNTSTTVTGATMVINTWHDLGIKVTGRDQVEYWFDGVKTGETTVSNMPANTVTLSPSIAISAATAAAATVNIQSFCAWQEAR